MAQSIKYESTKVEAAKSVGEIAELIRRYGGTRFEQLWGEDGRVIGVRFAIAHPEIGELPVVLAQKTGEIERILTGSGYRMGVTAAEKRDRPRRIHEQAERIAWRHAKDLTEQLLLSVRLGLRSLPGAFMSDIETLDEHTGETIRLEELFERRASLSVTGKGIELTAPRRPSEVIELPAPREG